MKFKYLLRGLGFGILMAGVILSISGRLSEEDMTDSEIIERAEELGMVMEDKSLDESLNQILNNQTEENQSESSQVEGAADTQENENNSTIPEPLEEEEKTTITRVTIMKGMNSEQVAAAFEQVGLVESAEEFDDYLCDNGYSLRLRVGTYEIEGTPTYEELAKRITARR